MPRTAGAVYSYTTPPEVGGLGRHRIEEGPPEMPEIKECFGRCANMTVKFRDHSKQHYLRVDEEKLKECDHCALFNKCMFVRYNEIIRELLQLIDRTGAETRPRLG